MPAEAFTLLDVSTLDISDGTFIDEEHREHVPDLSASIQLEGREARRYTLVEHKSYADKWALFQILRYLAQIWTRDTRTEASKPQDLRLGGLSATVLDSGASRPVLGSQRRHSGGRT